MPAVTAAFLGTRQPRASRVAMAFRLTPLFPSGAIRIVACGVIFVHLQIRRDRTVARGRSADAPAAAPTLRRLGARGSSMSFLAWVHKTLTLWIRVESQWHIEALYHFFLTAHVFSWKGCLFPIKIITSYCPPCIH